MIPDETKDVKAEECPVCGTPGKVVGNTTKNFQPDEMVIEWPSESEITNACDSWLQTRAFEHKAIIHLTWMACINWLRANVKMRSVDDVRADADAKIKVLSRMLELIANDALKEVKEM